MSFSLFLLYIAFTFLRPFEFLDQGFAQYRPMLVLWTLAFFPALFGALAGRGMAARPVHLWLLGVFMLSIFLSSALRAGPGYAVGALSDFSASAMLMVLALLNVTSLHRLRTTCLLIVGCVCLLALAAIAAYHTGFEVNRLVLAQSTYSQPEFDMPELDPTLPLVPADDESGRYMWRVRSVGFLSDPNDFAQAMVMVLPLVWLASLPGKGLRNLVVLGPPVGVLLYTTYLTHSRGAIVGLATMGLLGLSSVIGAVRAGLLTAAAIAGVALTTFGGGRSFSTQEASAGNRLDAWWSGLEMLKAYPLFGVGYNRFVDHHDLTAHNSLVLCFAELGLFGLFVWLAIVMTAYRGLTVTVNDDRAQQWPDEKRMAHLLRAALIGTLACSWFLSRTYSPNLYLLLALCVAGWHCAHVAASREEGGTLPLPPFAWSSVGAGVASIAAVYAFVMLQGGPS